MNFLKKVAFVTLILLNINSLQAQKETDVSLRFQLDSRNTFVDDKTVGIFGIRGGLLIKNKFEIGLGIYGSRLFNSLGTEVNKGYLDTSLTPAQTVPARIGFDYVSFYGEYVFLENQRWKLTANSQFGLGRVNIRIDENNTERLKRERKSLIEHSVVAKYGLLSWLDVIGGVGYRYLLSGQEQIRDAFNAPIYIISAEIDFKKFMQALKKK